ncbi:unnamed protein product [Sphenostylis stenocarpa]|uniref:Terpene synthase metal-binding domain-containing protein n=1 Tax=Sphenostylis stenocarpa TaxID=92480 RepID=A0AA86VNK6_9FABA|nr:unnamed protein product [Sphenostylis stenocarpa]
MKQWVQLLNGGHLARAEVYLKNGIVSTGVHVVLIPAFLLLDHSINMETVAIMDNFPQIVHSVAKILRLSDDLEGAIRVEMRRELMDLTLIAT